MPKISEARRSARRDEVLDAAQRVFARRGYGNASMSEIMTESGLSAGAIYGYVEGKQDLFRQVAERIMQVRITELAGSRPPEPRSPGQVMRDLLGDMRALPIMQIAPQIWAEAALDPEIGGIMAGVFTRMGAEIREEILTWAQLHPERIDGEPEEWADRTAPVVVSAVPGFILQRAVMPDFDDEAFLDALPGAFRG